MGSKTTSLIILLAMLIAMFCAVPALAQGDRMLAQVGDGTGPDSTQFMTRLKIANLGPTQSTEITQLKLLFLKQSGDPWLVATNLGTASEFPLDLGAFQTVSIKTAGTAPALTSGYAIVRNSEGATVYAEDCQVAITAYYEVRKGGAIIDTISVPVSEPTVSFVVPVENNSKGNLFTALAIVNLTDGTHTVRMQLFRETSPSSAPASDGGSATVTLNPVEQKAVFLYPEIRYRLPRTAGSGRHPPGPPGGSGHHRWDRHHAWRRGRVAQHATGHCRAGFTDCRQKRRLHRCRHGCGDGI
jgi:hypothetical protein